MTKKLKKVLKITAIVLLVLVALAFVTPFIFKGKILKIAKEQINKSLNAKVDFKDVDISFFRRFPRVAVGLEDISVVGMEDFSRDTLVSSKRIDVALSLTSLFGGKEMQIYSVTVDNPRIHALVNKEGKANWDIVKSEEEQKADTTATDSTSFKMNLNKYKIKNGYVYYNDETSGMSAEITNLNHEGSGNFTSEVFTLGTSTTADKVNFTYGGIPYLNNTAVDVDADVNIDTKNSKYSFKTDKIALNDLKISSEGFFQLVNDSVYNMDIKFNAPSTEFKSILSLIPAIYKNEFSKIKTSGSAIFNGFVKGTYSAETIPAFNLNLEVKDGFFQYPDLPKPVKNINITVKVDNPDGIMDHTVVDISKGHIEMDNAPFDFRLLLKQPMTDQYIDAAVKGKLDLSQVAQFVKLEKDTKLSGLVNADVQAKGSVAVIQQQKPGQFSAKGFIDVSNLYYSSKDFPTPIQNTNAKIIIENTDGIADNTVVNIPSAHVELGKDFADLSLLLKTPASDPYFDGKAKINFDLANVKQFYPLEGGATLTGLLKSDLSIQGKKSMIDKEQYDALHVAGTLNATNINYKSKDFPDGVALKNAQLTFNPKNVTINDISGSFMQSNFSTTGSFDNLIGYAMKDEPLAGSLNLSADKIDLNKIMGVESVTSTENKDESVTVTTSGPFEVPKNISFTVNAKANQVVYDKVDYNNVSGTLTVKDQTITLKDIKTNALDGYVGLSGTYSTKASKQQPAINLNVDIENVDIQKAFFAYNTMQKIMPIGKFLSGKLQTKLNLNGKLNSDMMPALSSLSGDGNVFLIQGFLSKFQPIDKLAQTLSISQLQQISVKDIKTSFQFANGKVLVKPFTVKVKDIEMEVGGTHGFDQTLEYIVNMKVPRSLLGSGANQLVNNLTAQATQKGIPVSVGDVIDFNVLMGGTINSPTIKTDLKNTATSLADEMKQQAQDFVKSQIDSTKTAVTSAVKDSLQSVKNQAVQGVKDELKKQLTGKSDTTAQQGGVQDSKKKVEESAKGLLNNLLKKKTTDSTKK